MNANTRDVLERARDEGGEEFALGIERLIRTYFPDVPAGLVAEWPKPTEAWEQADRIMQACVEVQAAIAEASPLLQSRLRGLIQMETERQGRAIVPQGEFKQRLEMDLDVVMNAAATIYQGQSKSRPKGAASAFIRALREHFAAYDVAWTPTQSDDYGTASLAVEIVMVSTGKKGAAAAKAIQREDISPPV